MRIHSVHIQPLDSGKEVLFSNRRHLATVKQNTDIKDVTSRSFLFCFCRLLTFWPVLQGQGFKPCSSLKILLFQLLYPLIPNIVIQILLTCLHRFYWLPIGRICLNIKTIHVWWSFAKFLWPVRVLIHWYDEEKFDADQLGLGWDLR